MRQHCSVGITASTSVPSTSKTKFEISGQGRFTGTFIGCGRVRPTLVLADRRRLIRVTPPIKRSRGDDGSAFAAHLALQRARPSSGWTYRSDSRAMPAARAASRGSGRDSKALVMATAAAKRVVTARRGDQEADDECHDGDSSPKPR